MVIVYLVLILPQMIDSAINDYKYLADDSLNDALSSIKKMSESIGLILGHIFGGFLLEIMDFKDTCAIFAFMFMLFGLYYVYGSGYLSTLTRKQTNPISVELMSSES